MLYNYQNPYKIKHIFREGRETLNVTKSRNRTKDPDDIANKKKTT